MMHPRSFRLRFSIWIASSADTAMTAAALIRTMFAKVLMSRCELSAVLGSSHDGARRTGGVHSVLLSDGRPEVPAYAAQRRSQYAAAPIATTAAPTATDETGRRNASGRQPASPMVGMVLRPNVHADAFAIA